MTQEIRRLQVDEARDRQERGVEALADEHDGERGLGVDHGTPGTDRVETREDDLALFLHEVGQRRVEVSAAPLAGELLRGRYSSEAVRDLDVFGDMGNPGGERDVFSLELSRPAASVPALVCRADGRDDLARQGELFGHRSRDGRVVRDHAVDLAVTGERKRQPEPKSVQRRVAGSQEPHPGGGHAHAPRLVVVLDRLQRDVVPEPLGLLVGVGVAADVDEQRGVVDDRTLFFSSPSPSASRNAIRHCRSTCSIGCPKPRSMPSESAATSSANRTCSRSVSPTVLSPMRQRTIGHAGPRGHSAMDAATPNSPALTRDVEWDLLEATKEGAAAEAPLSRRLPRTEPVSLDLRVRRTVAFRRGDLILRASARPARSPFRELTDPPTRG